MRFRGQLKNIEVTSATTYTIRVEMKSGEVMTFALTDTEPDETLLEAIRNLKNISFHAWHNDQFRVTWQSLPPELRDLLKQYRLDGV